MLNVRLHGAAQDEMIEAARYYDAIGPGFGRAFLADVAKGFALVAQHPGVAPSIASGVHRLVLAKFPFSLVYTICEDMPFVLAIAHQRRRPDYWLERSE